jgi:beta-glucanase (GH16 family)
MIAFVSTGSPGPSWNPDGAWNLIFEDEFAELDLATWERGWFGEGISGPVNGAETACYSSSSTHLSIVESPESSTDGRVLQMRILQEQNTSSRGTFQYTGALITTRGKKTFAYGAYEARMFLPASSGTTIANWPAFWTNGSNWPTNGELDIMEGLGGTAQAHWHGPSGGPGIGDGRSWGGQWHTYGAVREADRIDVYYDGELLGSLTLGDNAAQPADSPHYLIFQASMGTWGGPEVAPSDVLVDWVRVYESGPPASLAAGRLSGSNSRFSQASIRFNIPVEGNPVRILISDLRGEVIRALSGPEFYQNSAGIVWDGTNTYGNQVSPGPYIIKVTAGKHTTAGILHLSY